MDGTEIHREDNDMRWEPEVNDHSSSPDTTYSPSHMNVPPEEPHTLDIDHDFQRGSCRPLLMRYPHSCVVLVSVPYYLSIVSALHASVS